MQSNLSPLHQFPEWLPDGVRLYLDHTEDGMSLRALARRDGRHASTVMRLVRRYENRRDDPLMDEALSALSRGAVGAALDPVRKDSPMSAPIRAQSLTVDEATILQEGRRILRRLAEAGAVLAIAPDMEKAVVMREMPDGRTARTAIMERTVAQAIGNVDQASSALRSAAERRRRLEGGLLADAERVAKAAELAYQRGAMNLMDLLDARRTLRQVQLEAASARADYAKALAAWRLQADYGRSK